MLKNESDEASIKNRKTIFQKLKKKYPEESKARQYDRYIEVCTQKTFKNVIVIDYFYK